MSRSIPKKPTCVSRIESMVRWCVVLMTVGMFLFAQSAAMASVDGTHSASWMEICGDSEVKFAQPENESEKETCLHCDLCLAQVGAPIGALPHSFSDASISKFTSVLFVTGPIAHVYRAEQFWAANRGPPLKNKETNMMPNYARASITFGMVALSQGSFPWV